MRKILLAATAVVGLVGVVGSAYAQAPAPTVRPGRAGWVGAPGTGGVPSTTDEPGTVQAFFRGRMWTDLAITGDSGDNVGGNKSSSLYIGEFARIYPSFEGTTANGLKYGAFLEVRQSTFISSATAVTSNNTSASGNVGNTALIFRRETGYVGGSWGTVRFGSTDGVLALFQTGQFENFGDNWNGDAPGIINTNTAVTWPFPENSGNYGNSKVVYLSPSFSGFDFGISFEPTSSGSGESNNGVASLASPRLSSLGSGTFTAGLSQLQRQRNTLEVAGRYQGNLGPVAVAAMLGFMTSGTVKNNGLTGTTANGSPQYAFKTPFAYNFGLTAAYGGWAVGGDLYGGSVNPNGSRNTFPVKKGGKDALAFVLGTSYATGPWIVGASYLSVNRNGFDAENLAGSTSAQVGRMKEWGVAFGGTYAWGPGAALSVTYLYGERQQRGVNLRDGGSFSTTVGNRTHANALIATQFFSW